MKLAHLQRFLPYQLIQITIINTAFRVIQPNLMNRTLFIYMKQIEKREMSVSLLDLSFSLLSFEIVIHTLSDVRAALISIRWH